LFSALREFPPQEEFSTPITALARDQEHDIGDSGEEEGRPAVGIGP
jgi:hypothetical protein